MSAEYVKIAPTEMIFGETNLLQTQLSLLTMLKQYQEYVALRKEELFLKIELKKKLGEAKEFLDTLSKYLPESKFLEEQKKKELMQKELAEKIESAVQRTQRKEAKPWKEKGEAKRKSFLQVVKKAEKSEAKEQKEEKAEQSPLDKELEEIRKKLERLQ